MRSRRIRFSITLRRPDQDNVEETMKPFDEVQKEVIVLGCGNILFGDDGFGPAVAEHLLNTRPIPDRICVINAGTGVREILFDLVLSEQRPRKIIVIDAVDAKRRPGEIFTMDVDEIPTNKVDDFTLHHMPTVNLLKELKDFCRVEVVIIAVQIESIPENVRPGLSDALAGSVPLAAEEVLRWCQ